MLKIILVFSLRWNDPRYISEPYTSEKYIKHYNNTLQSILNFKLDFFSNNKWIIKNVVIFIASNSIFINTLNSLKSLKLGTIYN